MAANYTYNDYAVGLAKEYSDRFIDPSKSHTFTDWIFSKGTDIECYKMAMNATTDDEKFNNKINQVRIILYAITKPLKSEFFYWTLLLLILHKFNFKKPVMKIILAHYILRSIGDILEQFGTGFMTNYYAHDSSGNCLGGISAEKHPLRWFLTRQIGMIFWYFGEICGDWYPLLRTRAVAREQKSMYYVYIACGLFNLSKVVMVINHFTFPATRLFDSNGNFNSTSNDQFYGRYWIIEAIIIITSLIYDMTVYFVLKKQIFNRTKSDFGFLKKFRSISEYRIIVSVIICVTLLPFVLVAVGFKIFYMHRGKPGYDFSFEELRLIIINVQYYMIFIDQIMLFRSRGDTSLGESQSTTPYNTTTTNNNISGNNISGNNFSTNNLSSNNSNQYMKPANIDSKLYYTNLNNYSNLNSYSNLNNFSNLSGLNNQSNLLQYSYTNANNSNNMNYSRMKTRNNTPSTYDEYSPASNEWTYLRSKQ